MDLQWSSFLVVAAVFTVFSGSAWVWGRVQQRKRSRREAGWAALLQTPSTEHPVPPGQADTAPPRRSALPPDPSFADCPSFVSDSDSRRAALDEALDRMSRQPAMPVSTGDAWEDTEPSVTLSAVLPHGAGRRVAEQGKEAA